MKTAVLAGADNLVFTAADLLNPKKLKLVGFATTMEQAWNIYDEEKNVREAIEELPVMPMEAAVALEPDCIVLASGSAEDDEALKYMIYRAHFRGDVVSLFDFFQEFSLKTAAIRKLVWRMERMGIAGAAADLGAYRGDLSWQLNALMPERKLYLFDTFTGYDARDIEKEQELCLSDARAGDYSLSSRELANLKERILSRMPYRENVEIRAGWFPETAFDLEDERYALVHIDTGLYQPTYAGIQYFFPRLSRGGVLVVSGYEHGKSMAVRQAIDDLEETYGAFLITPVSDPEGTIIITHP